MKRKHGMLAGLVWVALLSGLYVQGSPDHGYPGSTRLTLPADSLPAQRAGKETNETSERTYCERLATDRRRIYSLIAWNYKILLQLNGVYRKQENENQGNEKQENEKQENGKQEDGKQVSGKEGNGNDGRVFIKILLVNRSGNDYTVDSFRFVIRSNQHETDEERLTPCYVYGNAKTVKPRSKELYVIVLPMFSLSGKQHLDIELLEKHGGRHLRLKMGKRPLLHARPA